MVIWMNLYDAIRYKNVRLVEKANSPLTLNLKSLA